LSARNDIPGFGRRNLLTPEGVLTYKPSTERAFRLTEAQIAYVCLNNYSAKTLSQRLGIPAPVIQHARALNRGRYPDPQTRSRLRKLERAAP
jgi:hypothetical protein